MKFWERKEEPSVATAPEDHVVRVELRDSVMSEPQARLFQALTAAIASSALVLPRIRLSHFLRLNSEDLGDAVLMDRKCVDFLICANEDLRPLAAVQLLSHESPDPDPYVSRALVRSGIPIWQIRERTNYPIDGVRQQILPRLEEAMQGRGGRPTKLRPMKTSATPR